MSLEDAVDTETVLRRLPDEPAGYSVYARGCPARLVFDRLADKWSLLIVKLLRTGAYRFNQLRREIDGISQKALSQTLQRLERDGLVNRNAFATVPVTVEYSLTELGHTLATLIDPLAVWAEAHIEEVLRAQESYDARR
ncbi:helix-turn-helix domain-containing protein [Trinickia caryophylli]|uniref:Transcriptional regulator, HxlR family n=1 Tax=Trinickia caryophylli TaxID=28094 RepID=A0A1X7DMX8_TRICW|nr:helix-turn-helix domain-containing protein [Trinickia caryophylli]PMS10670.1 transcriptional regulator [Trinickia caryophylli]TRX17143.1 helix-turn-helix transcriptional regulator [Trinickia caryophylli]WQE12123.1 helix-turn-helix domain-containing protein [Trinickia caryophylli]SMF17857.1 transcriptional regulator, HxlR family [Trinickia caryophylli]GLU31748.1 transcriptional regulator [Trinickia caryophylli]